MTRKELAWKSVFLQCTKPFQDFIKGESYWLEVINNPDNDMYCVKSDNLLNKQYRFSDKELMENFKDFKDFKDIMV